MDRLKVALGFYNGGEFAKSLDCTKLLTNWDDVTISLTREDYTGVVRNISTKFIFSSEAKEEILRYYKDYYLSTQIKINIYQISERWDYSLIFSGYLDFSTLEYDDYTLSINAKDNTLASAINANKSTKYEIKTNDIRADKPFLYERIKLLNRIQWTTDDSNEATNEPYKFKISHTFEEVDVNSQEFKQPVYISIPLAYMASGTYRLPFEYRDQTQQLISSSDITDYPGMINVIRQDIFRVCVKFRYKLSCTVGIASVFIGKPNSEISSQRLESNLEENVLNINAPFYNSIGVYGLYIKVERTSGLPGILDLEIIAPSDKDGYFTRGSIAYAECFSNGRNATFNCIDINKLLNKIAQNIYPKAQTQIDTLPVKSILVSGEDMRNFNDAKVNTSFNDFAKFMEVCYGFTYTITDNLIRFGRREDLFNRDIVKRVENYSDVHFSQDISLIYSTIEVGYSKQEYENAEGNNEFNATFQYTTGLSQTDNKLELICPYRADGYGFEFNVQEIENEKTDNTFSLNEEDAERTDNDIFVIAVEEKNDNYIPLRNNLAFVPCDVFSNGLDIGIKELFIKKEIPEKQELGEFTNYYLIKYLKDTVDDNSVVLEFAPVSQTGEVDESLSINILLWSDAGVKTYYTDEAIITVDWGKLLQSEEQDFTYLGNPKSFPVSYGCYKRTPFNYELNPTKCLNRNAFLFLSCTDEVKFASSDGNSKILFISNENNYLEKINNGISYGGRYMTITKITFNTSDTILPINKDGKVSIEINGRVYNGWIISANQNLGNNEAGEYELILSADG